MSTANVVHKGFVSLLGVTTIGAGVWLAASMFNGFSYHRQVGATLCLAVLTAFFFRDSGVQQAATHSNALLRLVRRLKAVGSHAQAKAAAKAQQNEVKSS